MNVNPPLDITRGDGKVFNLAITQNGAAFNPTGRSIWFTVKIKAADTVFVFQKSSTDSPGGITITNAAAGEATMEITPQDTEGLPFHDTILAFDLKLVDSTGKPHTLTSGELTVVANITRYRA